MTHQLLYQKLVEKVDVAVVFEEAELKLKTVFPTICAAVVPVKNIPPKVTLVWSPTQFILETKL